MWFFFFPSPESLLPWQQQKICTSGTERVSLWAASAWLVWTNKRCRKLCHERCCRRCCCCRRLLIAALFLPFALSLTTLLSCNIRPLFRWLVVWLVSTHPCHLTDSPFYLCYLVIFFELPAPAFTSFYPLHCVCYLLLLIAIFYADA